ncbi:MAG: hypothetical protein LBD55_06535 [Treponema sp.]|jgi:Zn/Cd-binding protein ZinT|nr:hypothetical protein [Treponema sp.]
MVLAQFNLELSKWEETWNSMTNYLDEDWSRQTFENGATGGMAADQLKGMFAEMMVIDFKSCVIIGDTLCL